MGMDKKEQAQWKVFMGYAYDIGLNVSRVTEQVKVLGGSKKNSSSLLYRLEDNARRLKAGSIDQGTFDYESKAIPADVEALKKVAAQAEELDKQFKPFKDETDAFFKYNSMMELGAANNKFVPTGDKLDDLFHDKDFKKRISYYGDSNATLTRMLGLTTEICAKYAKARAILKAPVVG